MTTEGKPRRRWLLRGVLLLFVLAAAGLLAGAGWLLMEYPHHRGPGRGAVVELELRAGTDLAAVARELAGHRALLDPLWFELYARVRGAAPRLREGTILLYDNMTPLELL
ncbi:MAG TPA: hypothetical protein VK509_15305, partial [Polyangiales bacterium]|nr:hypothetical protein [Polyangiales bacterium]